MKPVCILGLVVVGLLFIFLEEWMTSKYLQKRFFPGAWGNAFLFITTAMFFAILGFGLSYFFPETAAELTADTSKPETNDFEPIMTTTKDASSTELFTPNDFTD